jgi:hypothetical protein
MFFAVCVSAFLLTRVIEASPLQGQAALQKKVLGGEVLQFKLKFKGGQRACVIVIGDHRPVVSLDLKVEDDKGKLIGQDKYGGDFCAVIWYPPRDAEYVISVAVPHNGSEEDFDTLYIAVK